MRCLRVSREGIFSQHSDTSLHSINTHIFSHSPPWSGHKFRGSFVRKACPWHLDHRTNSCCHNSFFPFPVISTPPCLIVHDSNHLPPQPDRFKFCLFFCFKLKPFFVPFRLLSMCSWERKQANNFTTPASKHWEDQHQVTQKQAYVGSLRSAKTHTHTCEMP